MSTQGERAFGSMPRGVAIALVLACGLAAGAETPTSDADRLRLEQDNARLRRQVELASEKSSYLVLDLPGQRLRLMAGAAVLRDYTILRAEVGMPTLVFVGAGATDDWRDGVRAGAELDPGRRIGRIEMVPSGVPGDPVDVPVPAVPEEAIPAPDRYVLRYDDGFTIEVRADTSTGSGGFWSRIGSGVTAWLADAVEVAGGARAPRVRLVLSADDAGALYRSFPTDSKLLVL